MPFTDKCTNAISTKISHIGTDVAVYSDILIGFADILFKDLTGRISYFPVSNAYLNLIIKGEFRKRH